MATDPYWIIWAKDCPPLRYASESEARHFAEEYAKANPGKGYAVAKVVAECRAASVHWAEL